MNNPWLKILVFSLLFGAVGFLLGKQCGGGCGKDRGQCERGMGCSNGGEGKCDKEGCDHPGSMDGAGMGHGKACTGVCKGKCDGSCGGSCGGHGGRASACCAGHGSDPAKEIVAKLEAANFQGDTTIAVPGGTVKVNRKGTRTEVMVDIKDSVKVEEKVVEHHH